MTEACDSILKRDREARREAILDAAAEVFMEEGFAAASMSAIAARVGGSKGTLYNYFKSKEALFAAYIQRHCAWQQEAMFALVTPDSDIREALTHFGRSYLTSVFSEFSLRNFRLVIAEAERAPEIGKAFYEAGPLAGVKRVWPDISSDGQAMASSAWTIQWAPPTSSSVSARTDCSKPGCAPPCLN